MPLMVAKMHGSKFEIIPLHMYMQTDECLGYSYVAGAKGLNKCFPFVHKLFLYCFCQNYDSWVVLEKYFNTLTQFTQ
jgi:hypothetical protein